MPHGARTPLDLRPRSRGELPARLLVAGLLAGLGAAARGVADGGAADPFAGVLFLLAAGVLLARRGVGFDPAARRLRFWRGLGWGPLRAALWSREESLEGWEGVAYRERITTRQNSKGGTSTSYDYPVELRRGGGELELASYRTMFEARQAAKAAAVRLELDLLEGEAATPFTEVGLSLRERASRDGRAPPLPNAPQPCRLEVRLRPQGCEIGLPRPSLGSELKVSWGILTTIVAGLCAFFAWQLPAEQALKAAGLVLGVTAPSHLPVLIGLLRRDRVLVSSSELAVEHRLFGLLPLRSRLPSEDLELLEEIPAGTGALHDSFGPDGPGLRAAGDAGFVEFAWGLSEPERRYLRELILYAACS